MTKRQTLEQLHQRRSSLLERQNVLRRELEHVRAEVASIEPRMKALLSSIYGLDLGVEKAEPEERDSCPRGREEEGSKSPSGSTSLGPPLDPFQAIEILLKVGSGEPMDVDQTEEAWAVIMTRTEQSKKRWRAVQQVKEAIDRCGGRASRKGIFAALNDPSWGTNRLDKLLEADPHFQRGDDLLWHYARGAPALGSRERKVLTRVLRVRRVLQELGGSARPVVLLAAYQQTFDDMPEAATLGRLLASGPFSKDLETGQWRADPEAGWSVPTGSPHRPGARLRQTDAEFPIDLPREDWERRIWRDNQKPSWKMVQALGALIAEHPDRASISFLVKVIGRDRQVMARRVLQRDPHFVQEGDLVRFVEGPPYLGPRDAITWTRAEALRAAFVEAGGFLQFSQIPPALKEQGISVEISSVYGMLKRGPYSQVGHGRWKWSGP